MTQPTPNAFRIKCSKCSKVIRVPDSMRGKSGKCPKCGNPIRIPQAKQESIPPAKQTSNTDSIRDEIAKVAPSPDNANLPVGITGDPNAVSGGIQVLESRATTTIWLLRFTILVMVIHCFVFWLFYENGRSSTLNLVQLITFTVQLLACIVTAIFFLRWKYRAYANLQQACSSPLKFSPGWCCGYYFIPILNLYRPLQAMHEIQARSKANIGLFVYIWWGCWILSAIVSRATWNARNVKFDRICIVTIVSLSLAIIAGLYLLRIVKTVTEQQQKYRMAILPQ